MNTSLGLILVLGGTSTSGKTSIANYLKTKGYVCISLDEIFDEIRPDLTLNLYQDELMTQHPDRKEMIKRIKGYYFEGKKILVDEVFPTLLMKFFNPNKYNIKTILIYSGMDRLLINYHKRKFIDYRSIKSILAQFCQIYLVNDDKDGMIDTINKSEILKICHEDHKSFKNSGDLTSFVKNVNSKLGITSKNKYIHAREEYDLIINNCETVEKISTLILDFFANQKV